MRNLIIAAGAIAAITFATTETVEAGHRGRYYGGYGCNTGYYGGYYSGYSNRRYYQPVYRPAHTWHNTSYYNYYPSQFMRHGNRFDYQRTGHWRYNLR